MIVLILLILLSVMWLMAKIGVMIEPDTAEITSGQIVMICGRFPSGFT